MNTEQVLQLTPIERFFYWIQERESIRIKRLSEEPYPWTDDEILQQYRFCNIRRMDDRVSQWLYYNWYLPFRNHPNMLIACTLARQLNNTEALSAVGFPKQWTPAKFEKILEDRRAVGLKNYSGAYMIAGNFGTKGRAKQHKSYQTIYTVCDVIHRKRPTIHRHSMFQTWHGLVGLPGFRSFIAGQVVADLRWAISGKWNDRYTWAPLGPGSQRGIARLGYSVSTQEEFNVALDRVIDLCYKHLSSKILYLKQKRLEAMDFQNCLCEFDKYDKCLCKEQSPKRKYSVR